ncbi:MAG TPA: hypothetical protein VHR97_03020 [Candidatus Baltobacteraceae bacterium]|nr:hypothetical protein [Candidatus Baltobacteraceae bacterium]
MIRGAYGGCLYGNANPALRTTEADLSQYWSEHVRLAEGDAVVIVVLPTAPEAALLALAYGAAVARDQAKHVPAALRRIAGALRARPSLLGRSLTVRQRLTIFDPYMQPADSNS